MSGFEVIGLIMAFWPMVTGLARTYQGMKPGVGSRQLSRKLEIESTIFDKIVRDLTGAVIAPEEIQRLVQQESDEQRPLLEQALRQRLRRRLGRDKFQLTLDYLSDMKELLDALRGELENMCRGTVRLTSKPKSRQTANASCSEFWISSKRR